MTDVTFTSARERAVAAREAVVAAQKEMAESFKDALLEGLAPIFEKYDFFGAVGWVQYVPSFNDGDPCVFSTTFDYPGLHTTADLHPEDEDDLFPDGVGETSGEFYSRSGEFTWEAIPNPDDPYRSTHVKVPNPNYDVRYDECHGEVDIFFKELSGESESVLDGALEAAFGVHISVLVTRDGKIIVDEYDCGH